MVNVINYKKHLHLAVAQLSRRQVKHSQSSGDSRNVSYGGPDGATNNLGVSHQNQKS